MIAEKEKVEEYLVDTARYVKTKKGLIKKFEELMGEFNILTGTTSKFLDNPEEVIKELSTKELIIYNLQLFKAVKNPNINPELFFNTREIKEATTTYEGHTAQAKKFPYTFTRVFKLGDDYFAPADVTLLRELMNGKQIQYNFNTQRNAKYKRDVEGELIKTPRVNQRAVKEIQALFEEGKLITSQLTFNARLGSSDDDEELYYDEELGTLTITKGTLFDCLDGYHRLSGTVASQSKNPELNMEFMLKIINVSDAKAKEHFTQQNTFNPIPKSHHRKMNQNKFENFIVEFIQDNSELKDRVTTSNELGHSKQGFLTTFAILADFIENNYTITNRGEAIKTAKYLAEFFNELLFSFPDEFLGESVLNIKSKSYINLPTMFGGYIVLAKRMKDENINLSSLSNIINDIDFNKESISWLSENIKNPRKEIQVYFERLDLEKYK